MGGSLHLQAAPGIQQAMLCFFVHLQRDEDPMPYLCLQLPKQVQIVLDVSSHFVVSKVKPNKSYLKIDDLTPSTA